jgi:hypothetical protein
MRALFVCLCATVLLVSCDSPSAGRPSPTAPTPASPSPAPVPSTYTLSGVVRTSGNVPVSGAKVVVLGQESSASAITDGNGHYSISGVKAAPLEGMSPLLSASSAGYFTDVEFANRHYAPISSDTQVDFTLAPSMPILLGEVISGTAPIGDPICSHWGYGSGACQRFAVTVPTAGNLEVTLSAPVFNFDLDVVGPDGTFVLYSSTWVSPTRVTIRADGGSTYEIRVIGGWNPARDFELTTALR